MAEPTVRDHAESQRYELLQDGHVIGFLEYERRGDTLALNHTEIAPEHTGQGKGTLLVRGALDDARARGQHIVPACPFVAEFIRRFPRYADLAAPTADATP